VVRPGALHRVGAIAHAHVRRGTLTRADPRALVSVLLAREPVGPTARRILVGDRFGVLMTVHDREAVESPGRAAVDEVLTAALAEIGDVRHVGERQVAVRGAGVVVPGTEVRGDGVEAIRVGARGRDDRSEEHTSELQSLAYLVCRLLLEKKKKKKKKILNTIKLKHMNNTE